MVFCSFCLTFPPLTPQGCTIIFWMAELPVQGVINSIISGSVILREYYRSWDRNWCLKILVHEDNCFKWASKRILWFWKRTRSFDVEAIAFLICTLPSLYYPRNTGTTSPSKHKQGRVGAGEADRMEEPVLHCHPGSPKIPKLNLPNLTYPPPASHSGSNSSNPPQPRVDSDPHKSSKRKFFLPHHDQWRLPRGL